MALVSLQYLFWSGSTTKKGTITGATAMQFFICVEDVRALCHDTVSMWYANLIFRVRRRRRRIQTQWGSESADGFEEIRTFFRSMGIPLRPQSCSSRRKKNRKIPDILQAPTWPNSFSVFSRTLEYRKVPKISPTEFLLQFSYWEIKWKKITFDKRAWKKLIVRSSRK